MEILESKSGGALVLAIKGRVDAQSSAAAQQQILSLLDRGETRLVLDLSGLGYVSSAGLRVFMTAGKRLNSVKGKLAFCSLQEGTSELFEIAGFTSLFPIFPTVEEAVREITKSG